MKFHIVVFDIKYIKLKFVKIARNPSCRNVFRLLDFFEYLYIGKTTIMFLRLKIVSLWLLNLFDGFFVVGEFSAQIGFVVDPGFQVGHRFSS